MDLWSLEMWNLYFEKKLYIFAIGGYVWFNTLYTIIHPPLKDTNIYFRIKDFYISTNRYFVKVYKIRCKKKNELKTKIYKS